MVEIDSLVGRPNPGGMYCDPIFPVIGVRGKIGEVRDSLSSVVGAIRGSTGGSRREVFGRASEQARNVWAMLHHEQDHLRRQYSTSYGLMLIYLQLELRWKAAGVLPTLTSDSPIPLTEFGEKNWNTAIELYEEYESMRAEEQQRVLCGSTVSAFDRLEGTWRSGGSINGSLCDLMLMIFAGEGCFGQGASYACCPPEQWILSESRGWPNTLGGRTVLEFFAVLRQIDSESQMGLARNTQGLFGGRDQYGAVFRLFGQRTAGVFSDTVDRNNRAAGAIYNLFPLEFYALADLALWPAFVPPISPLVGKEWVFNDINPFWRLVKGVTIWERLGSPMTSINVDSAEKDFESFQLQICKEAGWVSPQQIAFYWNQWFSFAALESDDGTWNAFRSSTISHGREWMIRRNGNPLSMTLSDLDLGAENFNRFSVWVEMVDGLATPQVVRDGGEMVLKDYIEHMAVMKAILGRGIFSALDNEIKAGVFDKLKIEHDLSEASGKELRFRLGL